MDHCGADEMCLSKICFSDEATFHLSRMVNKHNISVWGSENPHKHIRDSLKVEVFCAMTSDIEYGPFFTEKKNNHLSQHAGDLADALTARREKGLFFSMTLHSHISTMKSQHSSTCSCLIIGSAKGGPFPGCSILQI
jgi:hypothetical protein